MNILYGSSYIESGLHEEVTIKGGEEGRDDIRPNSLVSAPIAAHRGCLQTSFHLPSSSVTVYIELLSVAVKCEQRQQAVP